MQVRLLVLFLLVAHIATAQDVYREHRASWLQKAEATKPVLTTTVKKPTAIVSIVKDEAAYQGWKATPLHPADFLYQGSFKNKSGIIADFGEHLTGYFTFSLEDIRGVADAPLRFKFTFAEVPAEAVTPFDPYTGVMSRAWLQDEIVTVSEVPNTITIPRRLAFRYVKIELLGSSPYSDFRFSNIE